MNVKLYVRYENDLPGYWVMSPNPLNNQESLLSLLVTSFNPIHDWVITERDDDIVTLRIHFPGDDENEWDNEDSKLKLSYENYQYIVQQWEKILKEEPKYFMLSRDHNGWISLEMSDELSLEDQQYLEQDRLKKLQQTCKK